MFGSGGNHREATVGEMSHARLRMGEGVRGEPLLLTARFLRNCLTCTMLAEEGSSGESGSTSGEEKFDSGMSVEPGPKDL